jgi:hypothetical protein
MAYVPFNIATNPATTAPISATIEQMELEMICGTGKGV